MIVHVLRTKTYKLHNIYINIFHHNQHTLCKQFHYMATCFDRELGSSSGQDTST
jgi:hypothetical protein